MKLIHNRSKVAIGVVALSLMIPVSAIAGNVQVRTGNVRATTYNNGNIHVSTGKTSVSVPARRNSVWYPWRYWRTPWRSSTCRQSAYQQTSQVSNSGGRVTHHSSTTSYCR